MAMEIERLNIFATAEELTYAKSCMNRPIMGMTNPEPPGPGVSPVVPMFESAQKVAHRYALAHGLPEIPGYYGMDMKTGEFVKAAA
jgi:hypothetical protein